MNLCDECEECYFPFDGTCMIDDKPVKMGDKCHKESKFIGYRDKDGYLVLPADWDDEQIQ